MQQARGPPSEGPAGLGRNREAWLGPGAEALFGLMRRVAGESPGSRQRRTEGRGCRGLERSVCQRPGAGRSQRVPPARAWLAPGGCSRFRTSDGGGVEGTTADHRGAQQGKGFAGKWVNPLNIPDAKRTESPPGSSTLRLFGTEVIF